MPGQALGKPKPNPEPAKPFETKPLGAEGEAFGPGRRRLCSRGSIREAYSACAFLLRHALSFPTQWLPCLRSARLASLLPAWPPAFRGLESLRAPTPKPLVERDAAEHCDLCVRSLVDFLGGTVEENH